MAKLSDFLRQITGTSKPRIEQLDFKGVKPPTSQTALKGGEQLFSEIQARLASRVNQEAIQRGTKGRIQASRGTFNRFTVPELQSFITAQGLKGSPGTGLFGKELGRQADVEADIFSRGSEREEDRAERARQQGFGGLQNFVGTEGNLQTNRAQFDRDLDVLNFNARNKARATTTAANQAQQQFLVQAAGAAAGVPISPTVSTGGGVGQQQTLGGVGQFTPLGASQSQLPDALKKFQSRFAKTGQAGRIR